MDNKNDRRVVPHDAEVHAQDVDWRATVRRTLGMLRRRSCINSVLSLGRRICKRRCRSGFVRAIRFMLLRSSPSSKDFVHE
jgi:hypothetical protein